MNRYEPRQFLDHFLEYLEQDFGQDEGSQEGFSRLMDWLVVETLESKELHNEINLLLTLQTEIEADCLQASVELPEEVEEIPAYRRPALETLLAKWRQALNRPDISISSNTLESYPEDEEGLTLAARSPDFGHPDAFMNLFSYPRLHSRKIRPSLGINAQRIETSDDFYSSFWNFEKPPVQISYEGPVLLIRTVITELRKVLGECFPVKIHAAQVFKVLPELRAKLPGSTSLAPISDELVNSICRGLGWNVVFRAR
jgi:hypothetical protein